MTVFLLSNQTTRKIAEGLKATEGLKVIGCPEVSVVAFGSDQFNIYALSDLMKKKGWNLSVLQVWMVLDEA